MAKNRLQEFREERIWSVKRLARESELSESVIKRMEEGQPTRRLSKLQVAKAFEKAIEEVFPDETPQVSTNNHRV